MNAKELLAGLAVFGERRGLGIERTRGERLVDRDAKRASAAIPANDPDRGSLQLTEKGSE